MTRRRIQESSKPPIARRKNKSVRVPSSRRYSVPVRAVSVAALACLLLACTGTRAGASHNVNLTEESNGKEIHLHVGDTFTLTLPETPGTGYRWKIEKDGAPVCSKISDAFSAPDTPRPGSPGTHEWRFRAGAPGAATIEMHLVRPWNGEPARAFALRLLVT